MPKYNCTYSYYESYEIEAESEEEAKEKFLEQVCDYPEDMWRGEVSAELVEEE